MLEQLTQLGKIVGPTAVVGVFAIYVLWQLLKEKRNNRNGSGKNVLEAIEKLKGNCLTELNNKIDKLDNKQDKVINLLIEIRTLLEK